jgi:hypothetical protein
VFDALAREVWIVARTGDALRHLPELRARTLPLMRRYTRKSAAATVGGGPPVTFKDINDAAIRYFGERRNRSIDDRAEWIYHRLLGGELPASVDGDWDDLIVPLLRGAEDDFPADNEAADYLAARTATDVVSAERFDRLPARLKLIHVARTGVQKGDLVEQSLDPMLRKMSLTRIPKMTPDVETARTALKIKCGHWRSLTDDDKQLEGLWRERATTAIAYHRARTTTSDEALDGEWRRSDTTLPSLVHELALARIHGLPMFRSLDQDVAKFLATRSASSDLGIGLPMIRTTMIFGEESTIPAARLWIGLMTERVRANEQFAFSAPEVLALTDEQDFEGMAGKLLAEIGVRVSDLRAMASGHASPSRFGHVQLSALIVESLTRRCRRASDDDVRALKVFASARDEDWLVPLAYAADRATNGSVPRAIADLFEHHEPVARTLLRRTVLSRTTIPTDILEVLRRADEASDLIGALRIFAGESQMPAGEDLRFLMNRYDEWRHHIRRLIDPQPGGTATA